MDQPHIKSLRGTQNTNCNPSGIEVEYDCLMAGYPKVDSPPEIKFSRKSIIEAERQLEEAKAKCFVVIGFRMELAQVQDSKVEAVDAQMKEKDTLGAIAGVQSVLMDDWSDTK